VHDGGYVVYSLFLSWIEGEEMRESLMNRDPYARTTRSRFSNALITALLPGNSFRAENAV